MSHIDGLQRWLRLGAHGPHHVRLDVYWLIGLSVLLIGTGIGLRDPWPADEPRFALVARDMVTTGDWLVPRVGGDVYADKPPLFFWLMALCLSLTHSLRAAFLLPSFAAGLGCVLLVYDLGRRLWSRETGFVAALALLFTVQFVWQARQAQIDATLCFWTTLSLYGLLRHLLLGPCWRWYVIGCAAAGFGVIAKGVGFLPLLVLLPFVILRARGWSDVRFAAKWGWMWGAVAFLAAIGVWLGPMLWVAHGDPVLAAYRDEILFDQTVDRFARAWHHQEPFWYFVVSVIPVMWLPLTALVPWLWSRWRNALRARDLRVALPLAWVALVVIFFSSSAGKRGVYVLPAVPAFALICGPYLTEVLTRRGPRRMGLCIAATLTGICAAAALYAIVRPDQRMELLRSYGIDVFWPLLFVAAVGVLLCVWLRVERGVAAYAGVLTTLLLVVSYWVNPLMNDVRSGARFVRTVEQRTQATHELGIVAFKEQYLLQLRRPIVHFGHARWREADAEMADAAAWLVERPGRALIVSARVRRACFSPAASERLAEANRTDWFLVRGGAAPECVTRGDARRAQRYVPREVF